MWSQYIYMSSIKTKAPYGCMGLNEYKLSDFVPEFFLNSINDDFFDLVVKIKISIISQCVIYK